MHGNKFLWRQRSRQRKDVDDPILYGPLGMQRPGRDHEFVASLDGRSRAALRVKKISITVHVVNMPVSGDLLVSHGATMAACTVAGLGPSLLPNWLCRDEITDGSLVDLFPDHECTATDFDTAVWLIYPSRSYLPTKVRVFVDFLRAEVTGPA